LHLRIPKICDGSRKVKLHHPVTDGCRSGVGQHHPGLGAGAPILDNFLPHLQGIIGRPRCWAGRWRDCWRRSGGGSWRRSGGGHGCCRAGATRPATTHDARFQRRGDIGHSQGRIIIKPAKIDITGGEKGLARWINALPDNIKNMPSCPLGQVDGEAVIISLEDGCRHERKKLEILPAQRFGRVVAGFGQIDFEVAWLMGCGGVENGVIPSGLNLRRRPIQPRQVESAVFIPPRPGQLSVRDQLPIISLRH
jgi:hypothetical protein